MTKADRTKQLPFNGVVIQYCQNKRERQNHTFRIDETGRGYYLVNGVEMDEKDFNNAYPIGLIDRSKGHLDTRQLYF